MTRPRVYTKHGIFGGRLLVFVTLPSTNQWLLEHAVNCNHGDAVRAVRQTAGRGRFERPWHMSDGKGLAVSVLLRTSGRDPSFDALYSQAAALAVAEELSAAQLPACLKWPNDVLVNGRKIAGILAERATDTEAVVIGIGVNINSTQADLTEKNLQEQATSVFMERAQPADIGRFCRRLLLRLENALAGLKKDGPDWLIRQWCQRDALAGQKLAVSTPRGVVCGSYAGMDLCGRLRLVDEDGVEQVLSAGDVSLQRQNCPVGST